MDRMTIKGFADALRSGVYRPGVPYWNEKGVRGCQGQVDYGDGCYIYKVSGTETDFTPTQVAGAITSDSARVDRLDDDGRTFDASVWCGDHCFMLWLRRKQNQRK